MQKNEALQQRISSTTSSPVDREQSSAVAIIESEKNAPVKQPDRFPHNLPRRLNLFLGQNSHAYAEIRDAGNPYALAIGNGKTNNLIRQLGLSEGITLRKADVADLNHHLQAQAEMAGVIKPVWYRVAHIEGGIEIDAGDAQHSRIRITPGKVEIITEGSETLFYRTKNMQPLALPANVGDLDLLKKYLNLHPASVMLFIAWITYTLAHPKVASTKYIILVLQGGQGAGKSALCRTIMMLIDPCIGGVQLMPANPKDLAIASQNAHVLCYDNVRDFRQSMSDVLCVASTGGTLASRQLYTDADQAVLHLHAALVLNGIHSFISEPDLAQRCLPLELLPIAEEKRRSEAEIAQKFQADLPAIMRGLYDLTANILAHLPTAQVINPERMIDFVHWIAAMEAADGIPAGTYQAAYSHTLQQGQLDSLLDNVLAAAVLEFAQEHVRGAWSGTPAELLAQINSSASIGTQRSRDWPQNPIALSKRLKPLQHSLMTQGINVEFGRGKNRSITIKNSGEKS